MDAGEPTCNSDRSPGILIIPSARQQRGHQEGSHLSLTWVGFPILFSLGDVSTDVFQSVKRDIGLEPTTFSLEG